MQFKRNAHALLALTLASVGSVDAFFRINCAKISVGRIDPIVNPGAIAAHCHSIVGGSNIGVNATFDSLYNSECTSCEISQDKSAYWTPNMYYQHPNGSFEEVPHDGSVVYYLARGAKADDMITFPKGFQMLSGNKALRANNQSGMTWGNSTYPNRPVADAVSFACLAAIPGPETPNLPADPTTCINGLRAQIHFQTCWNGKDLYKADNSHVAHLSQIDDGACPPGYPYQFPHIFLETSYSVAQISVKDGGRYVFSQGDPTGYGFHGDFQNAWNDEVLKDAIATCLVDGQDDAGTIDECPALRKYSSTEFTHNCPIRQSQIGEPATGMIDKLPGCVRITEGPGAATAADMECAANVPRPSITKTIDSTPVPTLVPSIGSSFGNKFQKALGCGNDSYGSTYRTLNAAYTTNDKMTVEYCQSYCTKRGYPYSGVESGTQCYCDLAINPTALFTEKLDFTNPDTCNMLCPGNRSEVCGGPFFINVFNNTDPSLKPNPDQNGSVIEMTTPIAPFLSTYLGCANEANGARALNGSRLVDSGMTIAKCAAAASTNNYAFFGLENGNECYGGNGLASESTFLNNTSTAASSCTKRCPGNFTQVCGGPNFLSVYKNTGFKPVIVQPSVGKFRTKGCLTEPSNGRALNGATMSASDMTVDKCIKFCLGKQFHYAGIEYGEQCWCDNSIGAGAVTKTCDTWNLIKCPGNQYQYCGAGNLLNLYYSPTL